jgi:hypothetical protein
VSLGRECPRWAGAWDGDARGGLEKCAVGGAPLAIDSGEGEWFRRCTPRVAARFPARLRGEHMTRLAPEGVHSTNDAGGESSDREPFTDVCVFGDARDDAAVCSAQDDLG